MILATKEQLEQLILIDNLPYTEIAKQFEVSDNTIRKWAKNLGIELPTRKKLIDLAICPNCQKEFKPIRNSKSTQCCCAECAYELKKKHNYEKYQEDNSIAFGQQNMQGYKKHFLLEQDNKCAICGLDNSWQEKELVFVLDHIDGNADNNVRENLRLVCPNCDSQLDTFKSKNKDSARSKYRK